MSIPPEYLTKDCTTEPSDGPVERIVYYFLSVPEPLRLPNGHVVETAELANFAELREQHRHGETHVDEWGVERLLASARIWQIAVSESQQLLPLVRSALEASQRAVPTLNHLVDAEELSLPTDTGSGLRETVVEVAVRVDNFREDSLAESFEFALDCVQAIQRSHYLVDQEPLTPLTVESAPPVVITAQREVSPNDGPNGGWPDGTELYLVNLNFNTHTEAEAWGTGKIEAFGEALGARRVAAFAPVATLTEEARHALLRRGDYRSAITVFHTASEVLFDTLLMHMLWEEGKSPQDAFSECFAERRLHARLKAHYAARLRGNWHFDRDGPMFDWSRHVASLRHRVVHGGHNATRSEAYMAEDAFKSLAEFVNERSTTPKFVRSYPVTALSLAGEDGIRNRGRWTRALDRLIHDPTDINWNETYDRWCFWLERERRGIDWIQTEDSDCVPVLLMEHGASDTWWVHDTVNHMVRRTAPPRDLSGHFAERIAELRSQFEALARVGDRSSIAWTGECGDEVAESTWLPDCDVLPFRGIMRDGSDERAPRV